MRRRIWTVLAIALACPLVASGWDAYGHRTITYLALDGLSVDMPAWLHDASVRNRIAIQSNEPDRWKGWPADCLRHINHPDHYLDVELLDEFGLTLETLPRLRREYLRALAIAKHEHPERVSPHDPRRDAARVYEWPGFVLHAIAENYAKLQATFHQIRILERLDDPRRGDQLELLKNNAIYHMGALSHFVGDVCQPLHTTKHFNGWVGDNPNGYTTDRTIHAYMDGALDSHGLTRAKLRPGVRFEASLNAADPWDDMVAYLLRSFDNVERVYQMEKDGSLRSEPGQRFIAARVADGAATLAALYNAAWTSAAPTAEQVADWVKYDDFDAESRLAAPAAQSSPE